MRSAKIARLGIAATVADLALLPETEPVRQIASVLRAGTVTLAQHPDELLNQVQGRVGPLPALHHPPARSLPSFALTTQSLRPADAALVTAFTGLTGWVNSCVFSPDGRYALSAAADQTLSLWEVATGMQHAAWYGEGAINCCAFSCMDDRVVAGDDLGSVHLLALIGLETRRAPQEAPTVLISYIGSKVFSAFWCGR